ncbi:MAG: gamma-glutamyltransferase [Lysobacteraceae bacterium]
MNLTHRLVVFVCTAVLACTAAIAAPDGSAHTRKSASDQATDRSSLPTHPPGAVIASAHYLATQAGKDVLAKGGNAFDAAVAVASTLGVVEPESSGIGGGGFFLIHVAKTNQDIFIDAREVAPASVTAAEYLGADDKLDHDKALDGPLSSGIPGEPAGWVYLSKHFGRLSLKQSLAPAIRVARDGFPVYQRMVDEYGAGCTAGYTDCSDVRAGVMRRWPATRAVYEPEGKPLQVGDTMRQPELAMTMQALADRGFDGFYRGPVAAKIVAAINAAGGHWTADDLTNYQIRLREPLRLHYQGWDIVTAPPPSSGGVAIAEMLNILSAWDLPKLDPAKRVHLIVEAMRRAFRDRTFFLGDPDFVKDMPIERLLSPYYADGLRAGISPDHATPSSMLPGMPPPKVGPHTTHFSIIDSEGNEVSATMTVNTAYGSGLIAAGTGVLLNNEMDDFALQAGVPNAYGVMGFDANSVKPGKRPLSSMSPTFMRGRDREIVLGTPGGSRIITMVLLGILGFDEGMTPQQVVVLPRFHHQYLPDQISIEKGALSPAIVEQLEAMGHKVSTRASTWGDMQAVEWNRRDNTLMGGSDPRHPEGKAEVFKAP